LIRAITFDLDDTLWPVMPAIERAEQRLYQWMKVQHPQVIETQGKDGIQRLRDQVIIDRPDLHHDFSALRLVCLEMAMLPCGCSEKDVKRAFEVFFEARNQVDLYQDVQPMLKRLSGQYLLATISNGNADIERIGLGSWFTLAVHARQVGYAKPHPEVFLTAARGLGLKPEQILHVGDHPEQDVAGARRAGFNAVWLNREDHRWGDVQHQETEKISSLDELEATLLKYI